MSELKKHKNILLFFLFILIGGLAGIFVLSKPSWDLLSYHYYNGWAFLNNRLDIDFFPALFRTYFNPFLDSLLYFMIEKLNNHPYVFLFLSGCKYGVFLYLSYLLFDFVFTNKDGEKKIFIWFCLILTVLSPIVLFCLEFSYADITLSLFGLGALIIFVKNLFINYSKQKVLWMFLCGFLSGAAVGLKYTMFVLCLGFFAGIAMYYRKLEKPLKTIFILLLSMFFGFILTDGYWMYILWKHFFNPFFPYFNNIFQSSMCDANSIFVSEFSHLRAKNLVDFIFKPLQNSRCGGVGLEFNYNDLKIPLTFIFVILYFLMLKKQDIKDKISEYTDIRIINFLVVYTVIAYYINLAFFGNYRYVLVLFPISAVIITTVCKMICEKINYKRIYVLLIGIVFVFGIFAHYPFRIMNNQHIKNVISVEDALIEDDATVFCGTMLSNFIVPNQNLKAKYIGFSLPKGYAKNGYWSREATLVNKYFEDDTVGNKISEILQTKQNIYFIYAKESLGDDEEMRLYVDALKEYSKGKINKVAKCKEISYSILNNTNIWEQIFICKIK